MFRGVVSGFGGFIFEGMRNHNGKDFIQVVC